MLEKVAQAIDAAWQSVGPTLSRTLQRVLVACPRASRRQVERVLACMAGPLADSTGILRTHLDATGPSARPLRAAMRAWVADTPPGPPSPFPPTSPGGGHGTAILSQAGGKEQPQEDEDDPGNCYNFEGPIAPGDFDLRPLVTRGARRRAAMGLFRCLQRMRTRSSRRGAGSGAGEDGGSESGSGDLLVQMADMLPRRGGGGSPGLRVLGFGCAWARRWVIEALQHERQAVAERERGPMPGSGAPGGVVSGGGVRHQREGAAVGGQVAAARALLLPPSGVTSVEDAKEAVVGVAMRGASVGAGPMGGVGAGTGASSGSGSSLPNLRVVPPPPVDPQEEVPDVMGPPPPSPTAKGRGAGRGAGAGHEQEQE